MPVQFHYLEQGIVHVRWMGKVTIEELDSVIVPVREKIDETGDAHYVEIVDLSECTQIPFDLRGLWRVGTFDARILGYVILKPTTLAKTMASMLTKVGGISFRHAESIEEAISACKTLINDHMTKKT